MARIPRKGIGQTLFIITMFLLSLSWVIVLMRVVVRWRIRSFGVDDILMCVGLVFYTLACQAVISMVCYGAADYLKNVTSQADVINAARWSFFFQLFYLLGTIPIKVSICVTLLRISYRVFHRLALYLAIFLTVLGALWSDIAILVNCKPVSASWDASRGRCYGPNLLLTASYVLSATSISSDWICAAISIFLLWRVRSMKGVKVPLVLVLVLAALASSATIIRLANVVYYERHPAEFLRGLGVGALWSIIESGVVLTAGSLPMLRPLLKRLPGCNSGVAELTPTGESGTTSRGPRRIPSSLKLDNLRHALSHTNSTACGAPNEAHDHKSAAHEHISQCEDRMHIRLENQVHVETDRTGRARRSRQEGDEGDSRGRACTTS